MGSVTRLPTMATIAVMVHSMIPNWRQLSIEAYYKISQ